MIFDIVYTAIIFAVNIIVVHGVAMYYPIIGAIMYVMLIVLFCLAVFPLPDVKGKRHRGSGKMGRVQNIQIYKKGASKNRFVEK